MKIKKTFILLFSLIITFIIAIAFLIVSLLKNQNNLLASAKMRYQSLVIADELRQSSDDLTRYCQLYVMTGDTTWEAKYWRVLQIRNGEYPRPDGRKISLVDSMKKLGFTQQEFNLLLSSEKHSNKLVRTERIAFNALKGKFMDSANVFSITGKPQIEFAQKIMFDKQYLSAKEKIMKPIGLFTKNIENRTQTTVDGFIKKGYILLFSSIILLILTIISALISYYLIKKKIIEQIKTDQALNESYKKLSKAKIKAEQSDKLKSAFLANMSHEIRTPINGILGFTDLLKDTDISDEEHKDYIGIIEKSGKRLLNIINDIVDVSKIEAGQMNITLTKVNINEKIKQIHTFFQKEAKDKGIQLSLKNNLSPEEASIVTDGEKVYAILINLIKNAIKFTDNGSIEIGYEKKNDYLEFFIKDTGIGIPKNKQKAIFKRFIQADLTNKMARQGTGLGLSIAKAYVEMLGGKIWVESKPGKGTTFYFTLPYNTESATNNSPKKSIPNAKENNQIKKLKILVAEDDEISRKLILMLLKPFGIEILSAKNGLETVEIYQNNPDIDLIIMDIQMPIMDGYEATKKIRELNSNVIIIAQTAFSLEGDREKTINSGCNDYISKPIKKEELNKVILKYFN